MRTGRSRPRSSAPASTCSPGGAGRSGRRPSSPCRRVGARCSSSRSPPASDRLGRLPYLGALDLVEGGPVGEPGGNSAFRLANVWGRLAVGSEPAASLSGVPGPVLLLDDVSDSRWTLTVCAGLLREAGAPAVLPMALAMEA